MRTIPLRTLLLIALVILVAVVVGVAAGFAFMGGEEDGAEAGAPVHVLLAAGDIAECDHEGDEATADILAEYPDATIAPLGDLAYQEGTRAEFESCYDPSWGRFKDRTRPATGNHEHSTTDAQGYWDYFGSRGGPYDNYYYSYDLGAWHVVVLNSNCSAVGGCGPTSPQVSWLKSDLAANAGEHVLAYFHHPRYSSGEHGNSLDVLTFWEVLYAAGADLVLNGHDHDYERFAPQDPWGRADDAFGIRQFVVGTGGRPPEGRSSTARNSQVFGTTHGVLKLTLRADGYDWAFVPIAGKTFTDSGSGTTHAPPPPRTRKAYPATGDSWVAQASPSRNYGKAATLVVDGDTGGGHDAHAYVKVKVTDATGTIDRVGLRLWVTNASRDGPTVAPTTCGWTPNTITWKNRPPATGSAVFDLRGATAGAWTELDVTPLVRGNGTFCFLLRPTSSDGLDVSSNQGAHPPRLVVDTLRAP